jgi:hypothetical protein
MTRGNRAPVGIATPITAQLSDREFFNAHPDQDIRRRLVVPSELPRSLVGRRVREVEVRNVEPGVLLRRFIDNDGAWIPLFPIFDPELSSTPEGRQKIASWQTVLDAFSSFITSCARPEPEGGKKESLTK